MSSTSAVILAGGDISAEWGKLAGVEKRALAPIGGISMAERVVSALKESGCFEQIILVGYGPDDRDIIKTASGKNYLESIQMGLEKVECPYFLQVTSDIPFLTKEAVQDFMKQSETCNADLCYGIVPLKLCNERYPTLKRTAVKLRDGEFTGGNLALWRTKFLNGRMNYLKMAYTARKSPLKLATMVGAGTIFRLMFWKLFPNSLSIDYLEKKIGGIMGGNLKAIISRYPEIATDIDTLEHWKSACTIIEPSDK